MAKKNSSNARNKPRRPNARVAAAQRAQKRRARRRLIVTLSVSAVVLGIVAALIIPFVGSDSNSRADTTTSIVGSTTTSTPPTTAAPLKSVKGKPCVPVAGALPKGAPKVPVQTGPPPTKLVVKDLVPGTGAVVKAGETLEVDYIGVACSTGKIFDQSYGDGKPREIALASVIKGWQDGIPGMKVGGSRLLGIPSDQAYAAQGREPEIAPDETLWFVVHVSSVK